MEERIAELEVRYTLLEDTLRQLSDVVARQDRELARLRADLDEQKSRRAAEPLPFDPDEKPPHY